MTHAMPCRILVVLMAALACAAPPSRADDGALRVLFIGNSLTYQNDLPAMVEAIAAMDAGAPRISCQMVAYPDASLADHWARGDALRLLRGERWTHIVLQQGPSSLEASRAELREWSARFAAEASARGARVVLYGVWPAKPRLRVQHAVSAAYREAARDVDGLFAPAGDAWRAAWALDPSLVLFDRDDFHPSPQGTYVAALTVFARLTGRSPAGLPAPSEGRHRALQAVRLTAAQLRAAQEGAAFAVRIVDTSGDAR